MDGSLVVDSCTLVLLQTCEGLLCVDLSSAAWVCIALECKALECKALAHGCPPWEARASMIQMCVDHPNCTLDTHDLV